MTKTKLYQIPAITLAGILIIAMSLRAPITGIAPAIGLIRDSMHLSAPAVGMLITLPLLAFAAGSLGAPALARRIGIERSLFAAMMLLAFGVLVRSTGTSFCLFAGTAMAGAGISIGNVLLPSLLKRDFPQRAAGLTAVYVLVLSVAASAASMIAVPLAQISASTWQFSSAMFVLFPLLAALAWTPQLARPHAVLQHASGISAHCVWRSPLAWHVTLYLGINSFVFYVCIGWLPIILQDAGYSAQRAGTLHGLLQLMSAAPALVLGPLLRRLPDQRGLGGLSALLSLAGLVGLAAWPRWNDIWVGLLGLGTGAGVMLGLAFVTLRTTGPQFAAALSSMAQCVGYLLAAGGPVLIGRLHDATGGWRTPLLLCALLSIAMAVFARSAGRNAHVEHGLPCRLSGAANAA